MKTQRTPEQHKCDRWEHERVAALASVFHFARLMNEEPCFIYATELREYAAKVATLSYKIAGVEA